MPRISRRKPLAALLAVTAALAIGVSGCGHGSGSGPAGSPARAIPASAIVYAQVDLDTSSPAWTAFQKVSQRFPGWQQLVTKVHGELLRSDHGVSFSKDVEPALGANAAIAVTGVDASTGKPAWVGYVALTDDSKIESDLKAGQGTSAGTYNGYQQYRQTDGSGAYAAVGKNGLLIASDESTLHTAIDTRDGADPSLAADSTFQQAMGALPAESIVKAFVDPGKISHLLSLSSFGSQLGGDAGALPASPVAQMSKELQGIQSAAFAVWATDGGYRATAKVTTVPGGSGSVASTFEHNPTLAALAPADAFLFVDGFGSGQSMHQTLSQPSMSAELGQIQRLTGISVTKDVLPLLTGEIGAYAAPGQASGTPRIALLLKPADEAAATTALTALMHHLTGLESSSRVPAGLIRWGHSGGTFAVGTDLSALESNPAPLAGSAGWNRLLSAAGAPADANVSLYVQVPSVLRLFPVEHNDNLDHVGGILAWSTVTGSQISADLFVGVR